METLSCLEKNQPETLDQKLTGLTRKQRKIYDMHLELFDAIFNSPKLEKYDHDLLNIIHLEQKEYLIEQLISCKSNEYRYMTIKGCREDVDRSINENLNELVGIVIGIVEDLEETKS